uniref:Activated RNA polymerase II transcriptional coactivator p15 n=1 Tax=Amphiprion percula TaxID=161767 RepID=A0A3P8U1Z7_AMPPE
MMSFPPEEKTGQTPRLSEGAVGSNGDDKVFQIGKMRYVDVRDFKGKSRWGDEAEGKGISSSPEQWNQAKDQISEIDDAIKRA